MEAEARELVWLLPDCHNSQPKITGKLAQKGEEVAQKLPLLIPYTLNGIPRHRGRGSQKTNSEGGESFNKGGGSMTPT